MFSKEGETRRKRRGSHPSPEKMAKIRQAYAEYINPDLTPEERPTQENLEVKYGIPQATLQVWFKKFDTEGVKPQDAQPLYPEDRRQPPTGQDRATLVTSRTTMKETVTNLSNRAKKTLEEAYVIGDLVVTRYSDLVSIAVAKGMKLEDFIIDVFNFYEGREEMERRIHDFLIEIAELRELTEPNYVFKRKSQCILDFAKECLSVVKSGARVNPRQAARALQHDLDKIDEEIERTYAQAMEA